MHDPPASPLARQRVILRGLSAAAGDLNGKGGLATDYGCTERVALATLGVEVSDLPEGDAYEDGKGWATASGRYTVRLDGPEKRLVKVKPSSLEYDELENVPDVD